MRFISCDAFASTGMELVGYNMYSYCNNSPVYYSDESGYRMVCSGAELSGGTFDYVIYYLHPDSDKNLDVNAFQNHSSADSYFVAVASFEEFANAMNNTPGYVNNIFVYLHGDESDLSFYYDLNYSAEDIQKTFNEIAIFGDIYLFSCRSGRGELASTMASMTNCTVIASVYKVSFGKNNARCSWWDYFLFSYGYSNFSWYSYSPDGAKNPYVDYLIYTK